ncbi:AraC family transcriptional regulator [Andreprevotia chitinilytica]|uniref:AraC family transcriptional regulator n=1 Tax=Andreprevotia chitinilytica TaxID=396808 RepID=UPI0012EBB6CB|nr:helix-turn-helix domain-containing protein [Andreprevotia chitinilytica]
MYLPFGYQEFPAHWSPDQPIEADWSYVAPQAGLHRVLPDGRIDLLTHFRLDEAGAMSDLQLIIAGPSTTFFDVPVQTGSAFLGVRFRAGWGGACLGVEPAAICDLTLVGGQVDALLGAHAAPLNLACNVIELHAALRDVSNALAARAQPVVSTQTQEAIDLLHVSGGRLHVAELARRAGTSERSLRRAMQQAVGLPVKTLASILRFQRTVRLLRADPALSLTAAAEEGGYSDQAHMAREFRRFGGFAPSDRNVLAHGDLPL